MVGPGGVPLPTITNNLGWQTGLKARVDPKCNLPAVANPPLYPRTDGTRAQAPGRSPDTPAAVVPNPRHHPAGAPRAILKMKWPPLGGAAIRVPSRQRGKTTCAHPLHSSNLKINGSRVPAVLATHSFAPPAARRSIRNAAADVSCIVVIGAATKRAGRAILLLQGVKARHHHARFLQIVAAPGSKKPR
jgi:hypothetical protein